MERFLRALLILALGSGCSRALEPATAGTGGHGGSSPSGGLTGRAGASGTAAGGGGAGTGAGGGGAGTGAGGGGAETGAGGGGAETGAGGGGAETGAGGGGVGGDRLGTGGDRMGTTGLGGVPGTGGGGGVGSGGPSDAGARDGGASFCSIPGPPQTGWADITVTWCDAARTCASCVATTGGYGVGLISMPNEPCAFPATLCPMADSQSIANGGVLPACTAHPDGEVYEGVLVQFVGVTVSPDGVTPASSCSGLDHEGSGDLPDFDFDVTPCGLEHFTCVADCSACP